MLRYYMTQETRQSLIEESNRLIAMRAIANAASGRRLPAPVRSGSAADSAADDAADAGWGSSRSESAFARLVADLEATSRGSSSATPLA
ncbi:MAG: hypothetical protein JO090_04090 [Rhizobacter sp.]|nr:hypothetical protein [Rhizobacter sp.]